MNDELVVKLGVYEHFKGGRYRVICVAKHTETLENLVIYEALYENETSKFWARPVEDFLGEKEVDGKTIKRFVYISE